MESKGKKKVIKYKKKVRRHEREMGSSNLHLEGVPEKENRQ